MHEKPLENKLLSAVLQRINVGCGKEDGITINGTLSRKKVLKAGISIAFMAATGCRSKTTKNDRSAVNQCCNNNHPSILVDVNICALVDAHIKLR